MRVECVHRALLASTGFVQLESRFPKTLNPKPRLGSQWTAIGTDALVYGRAGVTSLLMNSSAETQKGALINPDIGH